MEPITVLQNHPELVQEEALELKETHISNVLVGQKRVFKFKKPVTLDFIDQSPLSSRIRLCLQEYLLNSRLSPDVYLDVWIICEERHRNSAHQERLEDKHSDESTSVLNHISPDGSKIAFVSSAAGGPQIYMMSASGGAQTRLTHAGDYNYAPDWGPNGLIVFSGMENGVSDIFTVTTDGTINRLTQDQGSNRYPSWSGNGRYIAFAARRTNGSGIWLMSADGRYQYRIGPGGAPSNLAWQR